MKISYSWLETYFEEKIPAPEEVAELFSNRSYEVESVERGENGDTTLGVSVLPNRAHDSLCHRGVARELAALLGRKISLPARKRPEEAKTDFKIENREKKKCPRYVGKVIKNIRVKESPKWLRDRLISIGQRPINNVVDALNFVMFDTGEPMHAFDLDKLEGGIAIKNASLAEKFTTLDGKEVALSGEDLVIADGKKTLAIAGIKGGKKAEIDGNTSSVVLEAANFEPRGIRRTSKKIGIATDASKRFENGLAPEVAEAAMAEATSLILELSGSEATEISENLDLYPEKPTSPFYVGISLSEINGILGTGLRAAETEKIFDSLGFFWKKVKPLEEIKTEIPFLMGKEYAPVARVRFDAPQKFSCSSLTNYIFIRAGFALPSISVDQYAYSRRINESEARFGDLVFSNTGNGNIHYETKNWMKGFAVSEGIDHVGLYLGDGLVFHTSRYNGGKSFVEKISDSKVAFKNPRGFGRIVENPEEERYVVEIPPERLDLRVKEDIAEEIGRIYGLQKIAPLVPKNLAKKEINQTFLQTEKIKDLLVDAGFDEVNTYVFDASGDFTLENPVSKEAPYLRASLRGNLEKSLNFNEKNTPLFGAEDVSIFEIGKVFKKDGGETLSLCIAGNKNRVEAAVQNLEKFGRKSATKGRLGEHYFFAEWIDLEKTADGKDSSGIYEWVWADETVKFKPISPYPFVLRDIAVWLPDAADSGELEEIIRRRARGILQNMKMFDSFKKDGRTSRAYHLVFQSDEKTLTDAKVNETMAEIYSDIKKKNGWEAR